MRIELVSGELIDETESHWWLAGVLRSAPGIGDTVRYIMVKSPVGEVLIRSLMVTYRDSGLGSLIKGLGATDDGFLKEGIGSVGYINTNIKPGVIFKKESPVELDPFRVADISFVSSQYPGFIYTPVSMFHLSDSESIKSIKASGEVDVNDSIGIESFKIIVAKFKVNNNDK